MKWVLFYCVIIVFGWFVSSYKIYKLTHYLHFCTCLSMLNVGFPRFVKPAKSPKLLAEKAK